VVEFEFFPARVKDLWPLYFDVTLRINNSMEGMSIGSNSFSELLALISSVPKINNVWIFNLVDQAEILIPDNAEFKYLPMDALTFSILNNSIIFNHINIK
jgi:hypothetical protein